MDTTCNRIIKYYQKYKIEYDDRGILRTCNLKFDKKDVWEWLDNDNEITEEDGLYVCSILPLWLEKTKIIPSYNGDLVIKHLLETNTIKAIRSFNEYDNVKETEYLLSNWINPDWEKMKYRCSVNKLLEKNIYPSGLYLSKKM